MDGGGGGWLSLSGGLLDKGGWSVGVGVGGWRVGGRWVEGGGSGSLSGKTYYFYSGQIYQS